MRTAAAGDVEPCKPRSCAGQRHSPNADETTIEEWYKLNVAIPFLDHIIAELEAQFSPLAKISSKLLKLVSAIACGKDATVELLEQEITRWKLKYMSEIESKRPSSSASALKECDKNTYPNLYILLQIACTLATCLFL